VLGWSPARSWRDVLDDDGRLLPAAQELLEAGLTGVQLGLRATS
jgi:hypothetical protein